MPSDSPPAQHAASCMPACHMVLTVQRSICSLDNAGQQALGSLLTVAVECEKCTTSSPQFRPRWSFNSITSRLVSCVQVYSAVGMPDLLVPFSGVSAAFGSTVMPSEHAYVRANTSCEKVGLRVVCIFLRRMQRAIATMHLSTGSQTRVATWRQHLQSWQCREKAVQVVGRDWRAYTVNMKTCQPAQELDMPL